MVAKVVDQLNHTATWTSENTGLVSVYDIKDGDALNWSHTVHRVHAVNVLFVHTPPTAHEISFSVIII